MYFKCIYGYSYISRVSWCFENSFKRVLFDKYLLNSSYRDENNCRFEVIAQQYSFNHFSFPNSFIWVPILLCTSCQPQSPFIWSPWRLWGICIILYFYYINKHILSSHSVSPYLLKATFPLPINNNIFPQSHYFFNYYFAKGKIYSH